MGTDIKHHYTGTDISTIVHELYRNQQPTELIKTPYTFFGMINALSYKLILYFSLTWNIYKDKNNYTARIFVST